MSYTFLPDRGNTRLVKCSCFIAIKAIIRTKFTKHNGSHYIKNTEKGKGTAIPLQAWTGPDGSRRMRLPDFKTIGT